MRVVLDTNVFVSGVFFGGKPRKILDLIAEKHIIPCFTVFTYRELKRVVNDDKFARIRDSLSFSTSEFLHQLKSLSLLFDEANTRLPSVVKEDPADNYFLASAIIAQATFIVSGDKHLLALKKIQGILILTPTQFLSRIKRIKYTHRSHARRQF